MRFASKVDLWLVFVLGSALVLSLGGAFLVGTWIAAVPVALADGLILWVLFGTRYEVTDATLEVRCAFYRTTVPLSAIRTLVPSNDPLSAPALSLDRIEVRHDRGRVLVSPRDQAGFVAAIRQRAPRVEVVGLPGATSESSLDPGPRSRAGRIAFGAAVIEVGLVVVVGWMLYAGTRPATVSFGPASVTVSGMLSSTTFAPRDITMVFLGDRMPSVERKLFGFAALGSMRGRFRVEGFGDGYVFAERDQPYVLVRTAQSFVFVGFADPARTRQFYDDLRGRGPAR